MNWLCNHLKQRGGVVETASFIEGFLTRFISEGTRIIAVFDPENRHHSKKTSIVRVYDRNKAVLDVIRYKSRILVISRTLREESYATIEEKRILMEERKDLEKKVKSCESNSLARCSPDFLDEIRQSVEMDHT